MNIVPQNELSVKPFNNDRSAILELADDCLSQAQRFRAEWLAGGDPQAWQLWRACLADREALLGEMGR